MKRGVYRELADKLKAEFADGGCRIGETLPSVKELCARHGVGPFAMRHALRLLRDEGFITLRQNVGASVTGKAVRAWKGRVAFVAVGSPGSYYQAKLAIRLSEALCEAGWDLEPIFLETRRRPLEEGRVRALVANGLCLAIIHCSERQITEIFDHANIPYVVISGFGREYSNARAVIRTDFRRCYDDLIAAFKAADVKRVLEVDFERVVDRSFKLQLLRAGIEVRRELCSWDYDCPMRLVDVKNCAYQTVRRLLVDTHSRRELPDALLFDDDYLAFGGIVAVLEAGLRIPRDIRVVTHSNEGNEAVLGVSLARLESDPVVDGDTIADYVLNLLSGSRPAPPRLVPRFIAGDSL